MPQRDKQILKLDRKVEKLRLTRSFESSQEGRKVMEEVFDNLTLGVIFKLTCEKRIASVDFPVPPARRGNVFRATAPDGTLVAHKIYRTSNATFKNIAKYIEGDTRFKGPHRQSAQADLRLVHQGVQEPQPIGAGRRSGSHIPSGS